MKVAIIGAGGIGCYYGARLQRAGHDVVLVARGAHLAALQNHGLRLSHPSFNFHEPVCARSVAELQQQFSCEQFDLLILAAKSGATFALLDDLKPWLAMAATPVMSIQNGVRNEEEIARVIGAGRTAGGLAVRIGGHIEEPGCVSVTGVAQIETGAWPSAEENRALQQFLYGLADTFIAAGIPCQVHQDIRYALWRKLVVNNGVNPLSALTLLDTRSLTSDPVLGQTVYRLMEETGRAAVQAGVMLSSKDVEDMYELIRSFDASRACPR